MYHAKSLAIVTICLACLVTQGSSHPKATSRYSDLLSRPVLEKNTIVYFGIRNCRFCPAQKAIIRALEAEGYRVAIYDAIKDSSLYHDLRGKTTEVPLTVIVVDGKVKKRYKGITTGRRIRRMAQECRK